VPGACSSSPVDRPLFTQGPASPEFIYVPFPISLFPPSLPLVPEHSIALHEGVSVSPKPWGRETTHGRVEVGAKRRLLFPSYLVRLKPITYNPDRHREKARSLDKTDPFGVLLLHLTRDAIVNQVTLNVNLSFGYFWVGKFPYANA
jgi:hypothetical protein